MYMAARLQMWDKFWITKFSITKCLMRATYQVLLATHSGCLNFL